MGVAAVPGGGYDEGMQPHRLDFRDHRRSLRDNRYVYAVVSRRARGLSIGINLNPDKVCNFDCPYCQVDRTVPGGPRDVDLAVLQAELDDLLARVDDGSLWEEAPFDTAAPAMRVVRDVAIAGDGEPTSCTVFDEAIEVVGRVRAAHGLDGVALTLLTNATLFHRPRVAAGLSRFASLGGVVWAKLDAGTQDYFEEVDGTGLPLRRVVDNIVAEGRKQPLVLQCLFMTLDGDGPDDDELDAWQGRLREIQAAGARIALVQVYSIARRPAQARVGVLPVARLEEIGVRARALGLETVVVPGVG